MKLLYLSRWFPYPPDNGSKIRTFNLLRGLAQVHEITLLSFVDAPVLASDVDELRTLCKHIVTIPWKSFNPSSFRSLLGFLSTKPRSLVDTFSPEMAAHVEHELSTNSYDLVIASENDTAIYSHKFCGLPAILEELQLGVLYDQYKDARSVYRRIRHGITWKKNQRYFANILNNFSFITVVSDQEKRLLADIVPNPGLIEVIPNFINLPDYTCSYDKPENDSLVFTGSFSYYPNYDAIQWFLSEVYPLVKRQIPNLSLSITGDHLDLPLPTLQDVNRLGYVDNIIPVVASSSISIVPIRIGGGTRLKILEAMALRTPVVSTSKGAEGLEVQNSENILIADTPSDFSAAIIRLLNNETLQCSIAEKAYHLVATKYDLDVVIPRFLDLVDRATAQPPLIKH